VDDLRQELPEGLREGLPEGLREGLRAGLRDGLREEAAPISRRLAEVKGLSNNALRRLERLEALVESERSARVDDLALLVELLTEGWRTMNARLDRIEQALQPADTNVVPLRETA
jgi:flagellar biosynthesis/type III secretory pathway protein FliH